MNDVVFVNLLIFMELEFIYEKNHLRDYIVLFVECRRTKICNNKRRH